MLSSLGDSGRFVAEEWHDTREEARESLGEFEWGNFEFVQYDLEDIKFDREARTVKTEARTESEGSLKSGDVLHSGQKRVRSTDPTR